MFKKITLLLLCFTLAYPMVQAQHSIARQWNEQVLNAIRKDFARPTVQARNLFHTSVAMYDAWAIYTPYADTYFLGKNVHGFYTPVRNVGIPDNVQAAQEEAISFAVYRLIRHRFKDAPKADLILEEVDFFMRQLGYDYNNTSTNYHCGAAEMGNYIAQQLIEYGLQDGSNEEDMYKNRFYKPVNEPMYIKDSGNPNLTDFNRWQPLTLEVFIDQGGNPTGENTPPFLSPEWGAVLPFSLKQEDATIYNRDGFDYIVYHDPGPPAYIEGDGTPGIDNPYHWGHTLVSVWSSHHDPTDPTVWDISPGAKGNISQLPTDPEDYPNFYNLIEGGDNSTGHPLNPKTNVPYEPNLVKRSDYSRVLAEFWADGPTSETPPGHWFTILNKVNDDPLLEKRLMGTGAVLDDLEWDVKAYFILGGTLHDVAITSWGIKGWYDTIRPVSAIRGMAEQGQCSNSLLPSYNPKGLPLIPDFVEMIEAGDPLQGDNSEFVGQIKVYAWRGPAYINDPKIDAAGVGWIRAKDWWPYQRPSFVSPPFAGYISGHSTYSRAAAEVLTALTGDPFFPGGMGVFPCPKNEFLVFEEGPTDDVILQWATYRDASDQCSLSRIWGGIHPPADDIPGRLIGMQIGQEAFAFALPYFTKADEEPDPVTEVNLYPNPSNCGVFLEYKPDGPLDIQVFLPDGKLLLEGTVTIFDGRAFLDITDWPRGLLMVVGRGDDGKIVLREKMMVQ